MDEKYNSSCLLNVADALGEHSGKDVSDALQKIIDLNPNRTLFFPDGEYLLSKPVATPADPLKSVSLVLSDFAVLRAADDFCGEEAMVRLGGKCAANNIRLPGSNYALRGGIVDGSGRAKAVSIDGGRETFISDVSVKNALVGIHVKYGANSGSSDADINHVNIVGNGAFDSVGVLIEGYDNTVTNMRIANVRTGVKILSQGNSLRNIHPLFTGDFAFFPDSCGFYDTGGNNFYSFCYSDQFSTGFFTGKNALPGKYTDCFCLWYTSQSAPHIAFNAEKNFDALVSGFTVAFRPDAKDNYILKTGSDGGKGAFCNLIASFGHCHDDEYKKYLAGKSIPF